MKNAFLSRFTPSLMQAEALEAIFVQREREAQRTVELVRESALTSAKSHTLFVGPRGIGKTHLISLIYHRLRAMDDLHDRLVIAWLREEEWGVSSFLDLLQRILRALTEEYPALEPRVAAVQAAGTAAAAELVAQDLLREIVGTRTLLLLAENLDDLFEGMGNEGQKRFRAFLQNTRFATILATSQSLFGGVSRQNSPFYNFFRTEHLPSLSLDEAILLLTKIAQWEEDTSLVSFLNTPPGRARVRAIHHLSGGNPRVYIIFSEFLTRDTLDELVGPFLKMLDELTPYYQSKMHSLSPQQRKIIEILADARGAIPVKEIAARSFLTSQTVSSQLQELREKGYAASHKVGRDSYYELQEPLMRLCLEVKKQRGEPIKLFVDFLRLLYSREELERRLGSLSPGAMLTQAHLREALRQTEPGDTPLIRACLEDYDKFVVQKNHEKAVQVSEELIAIRGEASDWIANGESLFNLGRYEEALAAIEQALVLDPDNATYSYSKSVALGYLGRYEEAKVAFEQSLDLGPDDAWSWQSQGDILYFLGRYQEALESFDQAISLDGNEPVFRLSRAETMLFLDQWSEALAAFAELMPQFQDDPEELMSFTVPAMRHLLAGDQTLWRARAETLAALYEQHEKIPILGHALTLTIPNVNSPLISPMARQLWWETWRTAAGKTAELRLPLRLLDAAIRSHDSGTPPDPRILLELPVEERTILEALRDGATPENKHP